MRPRVLLAAPALAFLAACGADKLTPAIAQKLIAPDYPVIVPVRVPKHAQAEKGSEEHKRLEAINALLGKSGAIAIQSREEGTKVEYQYRLAPGAPASVKTTDKGFNLPAAEATFVKVLRAEGGGSRYRVTYQIRLAKPTPNFPLLQFLHPNFRLGDTHDRVATIERQGRDWALLDTNEEFKTKE